MSDDLFAGTVEANAQDSGAWWNQGASNKQWWEQPKKAETDTSRFDYASGTALALEEYARASERLRAVGVDPDTVDEREKDPWWAKGLRTLTGLGVTLDWMFGDAAVRMLLGGVTGLVQGKGFDYFTMQGAEVDKYAGADDYNQLLDTQKLLGVLPADWHAPSGKELLLMWGLDQGKDRKGKVDVIDMLGLGMEILTSPDAWVSLGMSSATEAGVRGGTKALKETSKGILDNLAGQVDNVIRSYGDDFSSVLARNADATPNHVQELIARALGKTTETVSGGVDTIAMLDRVSAIEQLDELGFLDNLMIGTRTARDELEIARSGLVPSVEEMAKAGGLDAFALAKKADGTTWANEDVSRLFKALEGVTNETWKAGDAFKELSRRAAEDVFSDYGGIKLGLPIISQLSPTGFGAFSIVKQRTIDDILARSGISTKVLDAWKKSIPGRAMVRTFVSDWRLKQLKTVDPGLANELIKLKRVAQSHSDKELHRAITGLVSMMQGISGKTDRLNLMKLIEAPGEIHAELMRVLDDSGITALRKMWQESGEPVDVARVGEVLLNHPQMQQLMGAVRATLPDMSGPLQRAIVNAAASDGMRFASDVFGSYEHLKNLTVGVQRRMLAEELFGEGARVPAKHILDDAGKRVVNPQRIMFNEAWAKAERDITPAVLERFLVEADDKALREFHTTVGSVLESHSSYGLYRVLEPLDLSDITQGDLAEAVTRLTQLTNSAQQLNATERAELIEGLVSEIGYLQTTMDEQLGALQETFIEAYGSAGQLPEDVIEGLRVGDYESLAMHERKLQVGLAKPTEELRGEAETYARMTVSTQDVGAMMQELRRRIDDDVFELMSLASAPVDDVDQAALILGNQLEALNDVITKGIPRNSRVLRAGPDGFRLLGQNVRIQDVDRLGSQRTLAFYLSRNGSVDDAARIYGHDVVEQVRKQLDENPQQLLSPQEVIIHRGKSQVRETFYLMTDDPKSVHSIGALTGTTDELGIPALKLTSDPVGAGGTAVRVSVNVRKAAVVYGGSLDDIAGDARRSIRIVGRPEPVRLVDLVDEGYDAIYVRSSFDGRTARPAQLYMLPDAESFHASMAKTYSTWPDGVPKGAAATPADTSRRPMMLSWRDETGESHTALLAGDEAAEVRELNVASRAGRAKAAELAGVPQDAKFRISSFDQFIPGARVIDFDPSAPTKLDEGLDYLLKALDVDPAFVLRQAYHNINDLPQDLMGHFFPVPLLGEERTMWGSDAFWANMDTAASGSGVDTVMTIDEIDERLLDAMSGGDDTGEIRALLENARIHIVSKDSHAFARSEPIGLYVPTTSLTADPLVADIYINARAFNYPSIRSEVSPFNVESHVPMTTLYHEMNHAIWDRIAGIDQIKIRDDLQETLRKAGDPNWQWNGYYLSAHETAARRAGWTYESVMREMTGYPGWTEVRFKDFEFAEGSKDAFFQAVTDTYGPGYLTRDEVRAMRVFYDPDSGLGIGVREVEHGTPAVPERLVPRTETVHVDDAPAGFMPRFTHDYEAVSGRVAIDSTGGIQITKTPEGEYIIDLLDNNGFLLDPPEEHMAFLPSKTYATAEEAEADMVNVLNDMRTYLSQNNVDRIKLRQWGFREQTRTLYEIRGLGVGRTETRVFNDVVPAVPAKPGKYVLEAPVNDSGIEGAAVQAFIQATNPYARMGADLSVNLPRAAKEMQWFLEAMGYEVTETADDIIRMTLNVSKWEDFLARNPKALTRGIVDDLVDGVGIDYVRYSVPLAEEGTPEAARAARRVVNIELMMRERDAALVKAIDGARFDELPKEWGAAAGLPPWESLDDVTKDAAKSLFMGADEVGVVVNLTEDQAGLARQWADSTRALADRLDLHPQETLEKLYGVSGTDAVTDLFSEQVRYASGLDLLSNSFMAADANVRTMERIAYSFMPKDMDEKQRRTAAAMVAYCDHYVREAELRGMVGENMIEEFKRQRVSSSVNIGGKDVVVGPGISQEAVDELMRRFAKPGAWVEMAKAYGLPTDDFAAFSQKLFDLSKSIYKQADQWTGLEGAARVTALQTLIARELGIDIKDATRITPTDLLLDAYEYMAHEAVGEPDAPLWRRAFGLIEDASPEEVNNRIFWHPVNTKMENWQIHRQIRGTVESINAVVGRELFQADPAKAMALYMQRAIKALTNYDMINSLLFMRDTFGKRVIMPAKYIAETGDWVAPTGYKVFTMSDVEKVGGDLDKLQTIFFESADELKGIWDKAGRVKLMAREEIVDEFEKASRHFFGDEQFAENMRLFDKVQGVWKTYATVVRPGFHIRNALSNVWLNLYAGVKDPMDYARALDVQVVGHKIEAYMLDALMGDATHSPRVFRDVISAYDEMVAKGLIEKKVMRFKGMKPMSYGDLYAMLSDNGIIGTGRIGTDIHVFTDQQLQKMSPVQRYLNPTSQAYFVTTAGRQFGETIENNARVAHFLRMFEETKGDAAAAGWSVRKYLFDYNELTDTERNVFRRMWPFYAWLRKNGELQVNMLMHRPALITAAVRTQTKLTSIDETEYRPEWVDELGGFALPGLTLGGLNKLVNKFTGGILNLDETSKQPMYVALGLPYLDLMNYNGRDILGALSPIVRAPVEVVTNHNMFFNTPIEDWEGQLVKAPGDWVAIDDAIMSYGNDETKEAWNGLLQKWGVYRNELTGQPMTGAWFAYIWQQAGPHLGAYGKAIPSDDPAWMMDAINFWTGVKFMPIDETSAAYYTERAKADQLDTAIRQLKQRGVEVPTWEELKDEAEGGAWWQ